MINNSFISEYLTSHENNFSTFDLDDTVKMYDDSTSASIFISANDDSLEQRELQYLFVSASGKDDNCDDEVADLFSTFCRNDEFLDD